MEEVKPAAVEIIAEEVKVDRNGNVVRRNAKGQWEKGYCPNPLGRPNPPEGFKLTLRNNAMAALHTILDIMNDPSARTADRIRAAEVVLERCYGKATTVISSDENAPLVIRLTGALDDWSK